MNIDTIHVGDCIPWLKGLPDDCADSCVTDPPYELGFMGKKWDGTGIAYSVEMWSEVLRVLKPGGFLLSFGGTRTYHRMACAIEDAGFEVRDMVQWLYGSGFPKSLSISKQLDSQEQKRRLEISNTLDKLEKVCIIEAWKTYSNAAKSAGIRFAKSGTGAGTVTIENASAAASVLPPVSLSRSNVDAIIAELGLSEAHHTYAEKSIVRNNADRKEKQDLAKSAASEQPSAQVKSMPIGIVQGDAKDLPSASTAQITKAGEALMTWLGKTKFSAETDTNALCAALTVALKHTILSRSKTFLRLDTAQQTELVSATNVTITESTAESLISFMVDTLRSKAIDKAAGAERAKVGTYKTPDGRDYTLEASCQRGYSKTTLSMGKDKGSERRIITKPATPEAKQWDGWGTALKPANEPICVARKPLSEKTVAKNVLKHGTGGINVDGGRINISAQDDIYAKNPHTVGTIGANGIYGAGKPSEYTVAKGRWPANVVLDEEAGRLLDEQSGGAGSTGGINKAGGCKFFMGGDKREAAMVRQNDTGGASRFFYCAKASKRERNMGCEGINNVHPCVKPTALMRWLCRLVTPPNGIILEPFAGSGTTCIAAIQEGFHYLGCEMDAEYVAIAEARIRAARQDTALFAGCD